MTFYSPTTQLRYVKHPEIINARRSHIATKVFTALCDLKPDLILDIARRQTCKHDKLFTVLQHPKDGGKLTLVGNIPELIAFDNQMGAIPAQIVTSLSDAEQLTLALFSAYQAVMGYPPMTYRERLDVIKHLFCRTIHSSDSLWSSPYWQRLFPDIKTVADLARHWGCSTKSLY